MSSRQTVTFRVVASPNREPPVPDPGGKQALYQQFFQRLIDELREKHKFTNARVGQPQNWYAFSSGTRGLQYCVSFAAGGRVRVEIYIDPGDRDQNVATLEALRADKSALEAGFGEPLEWELLEGRRACRVAVYRPGTVEDSTESLEEYHRWAIERLLRFKKVFGSRVPTLAARTDEGAGVTK